MLLKIVKNAGAGLALAAGLGMSLPVVAQPAQPGEYMDAVPIVGEEAPMVAQLPDVALSGEILYQILVADWAAQNGAWATATSTALELARNTRDPRLARRALEFALAGDNLPRAWDAARLWLELAPQDPQAYHTELMLAAANGNTEHLVETLRAQIAAANDKGEAIVQAQQVLSRLADKPRAFELLDQMVTGELRNLPEAHAALAQSAFDAGDHRRAVTEARAALAARPDWELAAGMVLQFGLLVEPQQALATARSFAERHPDARDLRLALVTALVQRGDYDGAIGELRAMAKYSPEDFVLLYLQGAISYEAGRPREAEKWLNEYIQVETRRRSASQDDFDPTSSLVDAQLLLARIAEQEGRYDQAYGILASMTAPEARFPARMRQAVVRAKQGRVDDAMLLLDSANPEDEREQVLQTLVRGQILRDAGRSSDAMRALEGGVAMLPENTELRYELAMLYEQNGRLDDMELQLRRVIAIDPTSAHAYNALGYTLADRNQRLDEAEQLIQRALQLEPNDAAILDSMGWVHYRQGNYAEAIEYLGRAWRLRSDAEIGAHLGEALWADGKKEEAMLIWRAVQTRSPDDPLLRSTLQRLGVQP
ncbi:tetratricopeptide repeat protein [Verticiella sediminum]|uniref:Tetratricopeptide repeat protein n=1 Tax=Verticiella sediminum TaxID=1247510 RepID=A0A556B2I1_9BURK|nr:tetratricopeptide repeat protein [Verticiella sediminum]TSH99015.1 tetratricopeptide repeat protein [Verticiella sediminum]